MSIKKSENRESLKNKLQNRGLIFNNKKLEESLVNFNYFNLFNGFENLLLPEPNKKYKQYHGETLDDFLELYKFDQELTALLRNKLSNIESKLKSSISYHFTQKYCSKIEHTMEYTNKENYHNPINGRYKDIYPFVENSSNRLQNYYIYNNFDDFILFKSDYLTKLINKYDHINKEFYTDINYDSSNNSKVAKYSINGVEDYNTAVPFWVAIETMTFGQLRFLLHYLTDDILNNVMKDFNLALSKRNQFLNIFDFLVCLRNSCSHGFLSNRFKTPNNYKINSGLIRSFNLNPKNTTGNNKSILQLYDVIKLLSFFEDLSDIKKSIKKIIYKNNKRIKCKRCYDLNERLLSRMGNKNYSNWKELFNTKKEKYEI